MRSVFWVGDSKKRLIDFPIAVRKKIGYTLEEIQGGEMPGNTKPLRGLSGVYEIVTDYKGNTYRTVFVLKLSSLIYVLHSFQKKSTQGIKTPKKEIDLIRRRLNIARQHAESERNNV